MIRHFVAMTLLLAVSGLSARADEIRSSWDEQYDRIWIGPEYWANPMEDWRLAGGRLELARGGAGRSVHLLTHQLGQQQGRLEMSVHVGRAGGAGNASGAAGFEIGIRSELGDYRSSLIRGRGRTFVVTTDGALQTPAGRTQVDGLADALANGVLLRLTVAPDGTNAGGYTAELTVENPDSGETLGRATAKLDGEDLVGNIALACNPGGRGRAGRGGQARFWFDDWSVRGSKVVEQPEQRFGPILYAMHTLSRGVMKMTAQMPPVGPEDSQAVVLEVPAEIAQSILNVPGVEVTTTDADGQTWAPIARATIDPYSRTAHFRVPDWPDSQDVPYRLVYRMRNRSGEGEVDVYPGTVRRDPVDKRVISVAGFTGHKDTAFPNELIVSNVLKHDPDVLLFTGDQIYEDAGGFGIIREPAEEAVVNYLRKIYLWGWSFRDTLRDRPSIVLPDDHDVYQGNIWGEGGKPLPGGVRDHDQGGFVEPPEFVNAVFRTQVGHHPDAYDATPMLQGIDVFYGDMLYGRISFAILEDRYFKSGPAGEVNTWPGRSDHVKDADFDTSKLDKPGLILLGERQLEFLDNWAEDWFEVDMKCVCSQTIFCNLANYHGPKQEFIFADLDSNGWPQTGRNRALDAMRRGFAFHYAGDQHLASIVHHGIDDWRDAGWSFCVPSTAAGYPRSWRPDAEGRPVQSRPEPGLPNTGDYRDGLGNLISVYAVGNPAEKNRKPVLELLHDKASGYGLVHFDKQERTIRMECFKLLFDAADPQPEDQFPGWPRTIHMYENYGRDAVAYLPTIRVEGRPNPIVQVKNEATDEIVYTVRMQGRQFRPKVFAEGTYTLQLWHDGGGMMRLEYFSNIETVGDDSDATLEVRFE
ncbi:PhoD-like phosphatase [Maioricimonas rarisocia]|uniref:PhoD-like phosphatase n=1 Tax=Maioricimonas rarisocia TaxID=2528026 RepID=A0A517Z444_9PLAN|nr:alkaline phosphatase D family protein [Maioricimonas rarisocia]QDU37215.1 PhoD-like phosphatase [Maioricimonas rarisocia]